MTNLFTEVVMFRHYIYIHVITNSRRKLCMLTRMILSPFPVTQNHTTAKNAELLNYCQKSRHDCDQK